MGKHGQVGLFNLASPKLTTALGIHPGWHRTVKTLFALQLKKLIWTSAFYTEPMTSIADLRKSYERAELNEDASQPDPLHQFAKWLKEAISSEVPEPNAMTLATVASDLRPSTRVVLIKGYDERGITWFTNYDSRKGQELAGNPYAALQFHWVELERVVRIEGVVEKVSTQESDDYFHSRPLDSRIGAWASPQSQVISGRSVLIANAAKYGAKFLLQPPRPPHWGGYRLKPDHWQFWQGRKSRLHDRLRYTRCQDAAPDSAADMIWTRERLAP
jgi:pyridoxamine 5'-phosphate oxidase